MPYIYELDQWPNFTWNSERIISALSEARYQQGVLLGSMESLGFELKCEAGLATLTNDVVKTSAIEGESLNPEEVRSSIAKKLGLEVGGLVPVGRDVDGIVEVMIDATRNHSSSLSEERLFGWHGALFPMGRSGLYKIEVAKWRPEEGGAMQVVSGAIGREKVHFEALESKRVPREMTVFIKWCNEKNNVDFILKAAISHLWFVTIHPFEDGNGRIGRAISDMFLARSDKSPDRFYSLSTQIEKQRKGYYEALESAQKGTLDITFWIIWFLESLNKALFNAQGTLEGIFQKSKIWKRANESGVNDRQRKIIAKLLNHFEGKLTSSKYAKIAKCSPDTALRDIQQLLKERILIQSVGGGRSTSYFLNNSFDSE